MLPSCKLSQQLTPTNSAADHVFSLAVRVAPTVLARPTRLLPVRASLSAAVSIAGRIAFAGPGGSSSPSSDPDLAISIGSVFGGRTGSVRCWNRRSTKILCPEFLEARRTAGGWTWAGASRDPVSRSPPDRAAGACSHFGRSLPADSLEQTASYTSASSGPFTLSCDRRAPCLDRLGPQHRCGINSKWVT